MVSLPHGVFYCLYVHQAVWNEQIKLKGTSNNAQYLSVKFYGVGEREIEKTDFLSLALNLRNLNRLNENQELTGWNDGLIVHCSLYQLVLKTGLESGVISRGSISDWEPQIYYLGQFRKLGHCALECHNFDALKERNCVHNVILLLYSVLVSVDGHSDYLHAESLMKKNRN